MKSFRSFMEELDTWSEDPEHISQAPHGSSRWHDELARYHHEQIVKDPKHKKFHIQRRNNHRELAKDTR